jgi:hypothetical protein
MLTFRAVPCGFECQRSTYSRLLDSIIPPLKVRRIACRHEAAGRRASARWPARWMLLHVIAETAQHAGHADHADIIRESLDGAKSMGWHPPLPQLADTTHLRHGWCNARSHRTASEWHCVPGAHW